MFLREKLNQRNYWSPALKNKDEKDQKKVLTHRKMSDRLNKLVDRAFKTL